MRIKFLIIALFLTLIACNIEVGEKSNQSNTDLEVDSTFNIEKWLVQEGKDFPYRDQMLNDIVYNDTVRSLTKDQILGLLGEPSRISDGHLYYMIEQKRLGDWPLSTKTLVIKISEADSIEWIKIHG